MEVGQIFTLYLDGVGMEVKVVEIDKDEAGNITGYTTVMI
jgi:hypothetical protein